MGLLGFLAQGVTLGISAAVTPGPFLAYLISQALRLGWRRALPVALAPLISDGPIILLVLLALARLPAGFLRILQVAGGIFVLFLAWKALQAFRADAGQPLTAGQERQSLPRAILTNILNPGPYIYWSLLAGPILVRGWNQAPENGIGFLAGFYGAMVAGLAALIVLFGSAARLGPKAYRVLLGLSAAALFGFGAYQLATGLLGQVV
jgi:threonine/homoserine/homoserine lactone efflux protein